MILILSLNYRQLTGGWLKQPMHFSTSTPGQRWQQVPCTDAGGKRTANSVVPRWRITRCPVQPDRGRPPSQFSVDWILLQSVIFDDALLGLLVVCVVGIGASLRAKLCHWRAGGGCRQRNPLGEMPGGADEFIRHDLFSGWNEFVRQFLYRPNTRTG